jgi:gamma-D-glutamyl-L-lysine dipeptidyl-peptidase
LNFAVCHIAMMPLRREARHGSEMVSQVLFGELFEVFESKEHWHKLRCDYDGYEGWAFSRELRDVNEDYVSKFRTEKPVYADINASLSRIPFGARLPLYSDGSIRLGDEIIAFEGNLFEGVHEAAHTSGNAIIQTAQRYLDAPYLWGGRSMSGIDCSGLTQMVFKLNGIALPRDAYQQAEKGETVNSLAEAKAGDLAFFAEVERVTHVGILTGDGHILHASEYVRMDKIDENGIFNRALNAYTLKVKSIKRFL